MRPAPIKAVTPALLRRCPVPLETGGGKEGRGVVVVAGGAPQMPGAIVLTATAALRAGAGKLRIVTPAGIAGLVGIAVPEAYVIGVEETQRGGFARRAAATIVAGAENADAIVIGPGMVDEAGSSPAIAGALEILALPAVIDAAALVALKYRPGILHKRGAPSVITPHCGEMAQLLGRDRDEIERDMPQSALDAARRFGAVVALKARDTHIATPDGERFRYQGGNVGLATSGSGDVLAGVIAGLLARGCKPLHAVLWAVYAHAGAGTRLARRIGVGFLARELPAEIPALLRTATPQE